MTAPPVIINVDDHEPSRYAKGRILARAGFTTYDAANGLDALRLISLHSPDLLLLDVHLPDVNGIEVCRRVKSTPDSASIIVLQISASATAASHAATALDSGADAYLVEPVDPDVLVSTIKALLRLRAAERELSTANERLNRLNLELRRSNEDLQQFAFAASHDLQEPLRTVSSFTSLLERTAAAKLTEQEKTFLRYISDGSRRMRDLIDDLLTYSQVGHKPQSSEMVNLNSVLAWALENLREGIAQSGTKVDAGTLPSVIGDEAQLGQVFQNLISNAIKYARAGLEPVIHVTATRQNEDWVIKIDDNGIGIAKDYLQVIFGPFKRLHGREIPGTGIGLAFCRRVIEAHDGKIWAESKVGEGSSFYLRMPVAPPALS